MMFNCYLNCREFFPLVSHGGHRSELRFIVIIIVMNVTDLAISIKSIFYNTSFLKGLEMAEE